jgi:hypothetical protein
MEQAHPRPNGDETVGEAEVAPPTGALRDVSAITEELQRLLGSVQAG